MSPIGFSNVYFGKPVTFSLEHLVEQAWLWKENDRLQFEGILTQNDSVDKNVCKIKVK